MPRNPEQNKEQQKRQPEGNYFGANNVHSVKAPNAQAQAPPPEPDAGCNEDVRVSWSRQN
jgi:hypothetical protein